MQPADDSHDALLAQIKELEAKVKLRTDQLISSTSRAYSFLDSLSMGFIMCDVNPEVVLTNQTVRQLLHSDGEVTLAIIDQAMQPAIQLKSLVTESLASSKPYQNDEVPFGKNILQVFIAPMIAKANDGSDEKIGAVILLEDITEQKNLERSKDEFLSIASHELRTPLTAIRGNSALLKKYYTASMTDKDMVEMVNDIHESSIRLIGIVNDFLDVSALEQGKIRITPESFGLNEVVTDVVRDLQSLCDSKGIHLVKDPSVESSPVVTADKQRIKQVIYNLVGNAVKFTESGSITISTQSDDHYVYTTVRDTGRGMSAENQRLLFRKFQQASSNILTRDTTKGTGLGLYISKLIVELSGGRIGLHDSAEGQGSAFVFTLPRTKD